MTNDTNKRRESDILLIAKFRPEHQAWGHYSGITSRVSDEGCIFETHTCPELKRGDILEIRLEHLKDNMTVTLHGEITGKKVSWYKDIIEIRFYEIDDETRGRIKELISLSLNKEQTGNKDETVKVDGSVLTIHHKNDGDMPSIGKHCDTVSCTSNDEVRICEITGKDDNQVKMDKRHDAHAQSRHALTSDRDIEDKNVHISCEENSLMAIDRICANKYRLTFRRLIYVVVAFVIIFFVVSIPIRNRNINKTSEIKAPVEDVKKSNLAGQYERPTDVVDKIDSVPFMKTIKNTIEGPAVESNSIYAEEATVTKEEKVVSIPAFSHDLIYTIQTASFKVLENAREAYESIIKILNKKDLDYLRIEKVGEYYAVRIRKFDDRMHAEMFHESIKPLMTETLLMKTFILDERIISMYSDTAEILPE